MTAGAAVQKLMMSLQNEQEILMNIADMAILTFHAESALLRLMNCRKNKNSLPLQYISMYSIATLRKPWINSTQPAVRPLMPCLRRRTADDVTGPETVYQTGTFNAKDARRRIADKMIAENRYAL